MNGMTTLNMMVRYDCPTCAETTLADLISVSGVQLDEIQLNNVQLFDEHVGACVDCGTAFDFDPILYRVRPPALRVAA